MAQPSQWPTNNPVKWSDLFEALSKQERIPDWPLLSNMITNLDCKTCGLQFVSSINYRRHLLTHSLTNDAEKELADNKDLIQKYWDSLPSDECKKIVSLKDVPLKGESGIAIFQRLESYIKKPKVILPGAYMRAGTSLIHVVKSMPAKRTTSNELFKILSAASEQTFLCTVIDESVQTNVFEGDDKISEENLIACVCFLLERKLVEFWEKEKTLQALFREIDEEKERDENKRNKKKEKKQRQQQKKNEAKTRKQIVETKLPEGIHEDASTSPTETSASGQHPPDVDLSAQVAQLGQSSQTSIPLDGEKAVDGGCGLEEQSSNEETKEEEICADSGKKVPDVEPEKNVQGVKDPPEEPRQGKIKKETIGKGKEIWVKKLGDTSDTPLSRSTDISRPDAAPAIEESKAQAPPAQLDQSLDASQIRGVKNKDGEGKLKKGLKARKDKHSQVMIDTSTKVKQRGNLPGAVQVSDAGKEKDGDLEQKAETAGEQKREDVKNASELLPSRETSRSSAPSENPIETPVTQPDQSPSLPKPVVLSDADQQSIGQLHSPPDQQKTGLGASVEMHHGITEERVKSDFDGNEYNKDIAAIAPLADDPDAITKALEELGKAWEWMLYNLYQVAHRQTTRHLLRERVFRESNDEL